MCVNANKPKTSTELGEGVGLLFGTGERLCARLLHWARRLPSMREASGVIPVILVNAQLLHSFSIIFQICFLKAGWVETLLPCSAAENGNKMNDAFYVL